MMPNIQTPLFNPGNRTARRLLISVILFSTVITLTISAIQLYRDYRLDVTFIDAQLQQIQDVNLKTLVNNLWVLDIDQLKIHLDGILRLPDMQYMAIRDSHHVLVSSGKIKEKNTISRTFPMINVYRGKQLKIGTLKVVATLDGVYSRLIDKAIIILISNGIKTFLVAGFILYLFQLLVSRHLVRIAKFISEHDLSKDIEPLQLDRKTPKRLKQDELDLVVEGLNTMRQNLQESFGLLKESETRFRQLAENLKEVFWLSSADWKKVIYVSPAFETIWGISVENLYKNPRLWIEAVHPDDRDNLIADIPSSPNKIGEFIQFRDYRIQNSNGDSHWIRARAYPIYDEHKNVIRIAGIAEDITANKKITLQLRQSQKMEALGKLTGGVAHDYNNILSVILGYSELLESMLGDQPNLIEYVHEIQHSGERGAKLAKKLLAFSSQKPGDEQVLNINSVLQGEQDMLEKTLTVRIKLVLELADDLWPVKIDESDLEDAILNMSINAMHSITGHGQITIQTCNIQIKEADADLIEVEAGDFVLINFTDTGCGMNEETKERLFEPFFSTKGGLGSGLGLSQVYGFVERSHGAINVYSEPDHGACFKLYLPRCDTPTSIDEKQNKNNNMKLSGNESLLIVDDETAILDLTYNILSQQGYKVFCVNSGAEALLKLKATSIDLLISDVIMPEMDGYELATIVQEKYPDIKILLASGFSDQRHKIMSDDTLYKNLLDKPYTTQTLLMRVRTLLG